MASGETSGKSVANFVDFNFKRCEKCVISGETKGSEALFLKAVTVWILKPHVVNRRLCGSKLISIHRFHTNKEINDFGKDSRNIFASQESDKPPSFEDLSTETSPYTVVVRDLIPKSEFFPKVHEVLIYDKAAKTVKFIPIIDGEFTTETSNLYTNEIPYSVQLKCADVESSQVSSNEVVMSWSCDHEEPDVSKRQLSSKWLSSILLEKLINWSHIQDISTSITSLQLVDVDKYQKTYIRLKNAYGRDLVKNWTESTDPSKFVYEDIAIASYLLLIWEEDRRMKNLQDKQSFVDLGCGNGLLVYILTREGHKGLGIDLRKRKIWDTFGPDIDLQEMTVTPSADHLFPDYDWLIGNHSDELTPWIPVISARSSYNNCFFVLPCCHHDFVGKFTTSEKGKSKYASYLSYVKDVISNCGFKPECDTLRIPSTKRICYIGRYRTYDKDKGEQADKEMQNFIDKRCKLRQNEMANSSKMMQGIEPVKEEFNHEDRNMSNSSQSSSENPSCSTYSPNLRVSDNSDPLLSSEKRKTPDSCDKSSPNNNELRGFSPCFKKSRIEPESDANIIESNSVNKDTSQSKSKTNEVNGTNVPASPWVSDFQPRVETKVRNCQRVSDETKLKIVEAVFNLVLSADSDNVVLLDDNRKWCKGGVVPLSEVVSLFDKSILQELKSECGGLQTLLRNHGHVFQVTGGNVQLRDFTKANPWDGRNPQKTKDKQRNTLKTTLCWFFTRHPDGCPKAKADCLFAHGKHDLREKVIKT